MANFCRHCGNPVLEGAQFCPACGKPLTPTTETTHLSPRQQAAKEQAERMKAAMVPQIRDLAAAAAPGEFDCGEMILPGLMNEAVPVNMPGFGNARGQAAGAVRAAAGNASYRMAGAAAGRMADPSAARMAGAAAGGLTEVLPPFAGILQGIRSLFRGVPQIFRNPAALIGTLVLALLWFVLGMFRNSDSSIIRFLSWLTFAEGGFDRSAAGMLFGALGKGTVAAAWMSLVSGGFPKALSGLAAFVKGKGERRSIVSILLGLIMGWLIYLIFTGPGKRSPEMSMAGIAGALLSLEALGSGSGQIYGLAQSLTSKFLYGKRMAEQGKCDGLLTGLAAGFALGAAFSLLA